MAGDPGRHRVVIVGGGFAGLFAARAAAGQRLGDADRPGPAPPVLSGRAEAILRTLGVELHMGTIVTQVGPGWLEVRNHAGQQTRYDAETVLWAAGVEAPPVAEALARATGAKRDKSGRILVEKDLTIPGHPEIRSWRVSQVRFPR
jgi:NADH dehydrogenase FAD-containing subunit